MKTALFVDDNDELRGATGETLEEMGYAVTTAANAQEALDAPVGFDLLVSDVYMPGMNGIELADRLLARQPGLAVLLISSRGGEPEVRRRLAQGDVAFLPKPFSPDELATKVRDAFDRVSGRPSKSAAGRAFGAPTPELAAEDSEQGPEPKDSRSRMPKGVPQLVGAVVLVLGLGALLRGFELGAPPLPAPASESPTRSATIEIVRPLGPLAAVPDELVWLPVSGASSYTVSLRTIDGAALWQTEVAGPPTDLPTELKAGLHPAVTYYWSAEALDGERRLLGRSELAPFVIELKL